MFILHIITSKIQMKKKKKSKETGIEYEKEATYIGGYFLKKKRNKARERMNNGKRQVIATYFLMKRHSC